MGKKVLLTPFRPVMLKQILHLIKRYWFLRLLIVRFWGCRLENSMRNVIILSFASALAMSGPPIVVLLGGILDRGGSARYCAGAFGAR